MASQKMRMIVKEEKKRRMMRMSKGTLYATLVGTITLTMSSGFAAMFARDGSIISVRGSLLRALNTSHSPRVAMGKGKSVYPTHLPWKTTITYKKEVEMMLSVARTYLQKSKVSSPEKAESNPSPAGGG